MIQDYSLNLNVTNGCLRHISILCGNGGLFLDFETERGADGAMSEYFFPDVAVETVRMAKLGDRDAAHDPFDLYLPLIRYEQQLNFGLALRKYVLMRRRTLTCDTQRKLAVRYGATLIPSALVGDVLESRHSARTPRSLDYAESRVRGSVAGSISPE